MTVGFLLLWLMLSDMVLHSVLLGKLVSYGISTGFVFTWPIDCVIFIFPEFFSSPFISLTDIPQDSILGPLLFRIFISDLHSKIRIVFFSFCWYKNLSPCYINRWLPSFTVIY
jgi:hypothetical protein